MKLTSLAGFPLIIAVVISGLVLGIAHAEDGSRSAPAALIAARLPDLKSADLSLKINALTFLVDQGTADTRPATLAALLEVWPDPQAAEIFTAKGSELLQAWRKSTTDLDAADQARVAAVVLKSLKDPNLDDFRRGEGFATMGRLGEHGKEAVPQAVEYLQGSSTNGWSLARALHLVTQHDKLKALDLAEKLMSHPLLSVRAAAAQAVGTHATPADSPRFLAAIHRMFSSDPELDVRFRAGAALKTLLGEDAAFDLFKKNLTSNSKTTKENALRLMGLFGARGVPILKAHIFDNGYEWAALDAIIRIGPPAISLLPEVKQSQANPHPGVKSFADRARISIMGSDKATISGIGAKLKQQSGAIVVESVVPNSPAAKAGITAGMKLLSIDGKEVNQSDVDAAVLRIRGTEGSAITIELSNAQGVKQRFSLLRQNVYVSDSKPATK